MTGLSRRARAGRLALAAAILGAAVAASRLRVPVICPLHTVTGLPCPLCGGTRATRALLHGDLAQAIYLNPLAIPAVALLAILLGLLVWEGLRGRRAFDWTILSRHALPITAGATLVLLVWWPFHLAQALGQPKRELLRLDNPVARAIYEQIHPADRR